MAPLHNHGQTHYEALGIPIYATIEQIKKAYRIIQLEYHPDKTRALPQEEQKEGEAISKAANAAYEILSDVSKRRTYDLALPSILQARKAAHTQSYPSSRPPNTSNPRPNLATFVSAYTPEWTFTWPTTCPRTMHFAQGGWRLVVNLGVRFTPTEWGPNRVWVSGDNVLIYAKVEERRRLPYDDDDVNITIIETPHHRQISKIESYYKHRAFEGTPETLICIRICPCNEEGNRMVEYFDFAWHLDTSRCVPAFGATNYHTAMFFYRRKEDALNDHTSPRREIEKDKDMQPKTDVVMVDMGAEASKEVYYLNTKMWRSAVFGYRSRYIAAQKNEHADPTHMKEEAGPTTPKAARKRPAEQKQQARAGSEQDQKTERQKEGRATTKQETGREDATGPQYRSPRSLPREDHSVRTGEKRPFPSEVEPAASKRVRREQPPWGKQSATYDRWE